MKQYCFDIAKQIRLTSNHQIKVGAVLERGGRILGVAANKRGSAKRGWYEYSRHAEGNLLTSGLGSSFKGADVYVYREHGTNGKRLLSRPCRLCVLILHQAGIKNVYYTTNDGWEQMRIN